MAKSRDILETILSELSRIPASSASELIEYLSDAIYRISGSRLLAIWSEISSSDFDEPQYIRTFADRDAIDYRSIQEPEILDNISNIYNEEHVFCLDISVSISPSVTRTVKYIVVLQNNKNIEADTKVLSIFIQSTLAKHISWFQGMIRDRVVEATASSSDLGSFLHRIIKNLILEWFDCEAVTFFYYDKTTDALVQAAGTGIAFQKEYRLKRSDIRYFMDSSSYTVRSFKESKPIIERELDMQAPVKENTYGEDVTNIRSRIYLPLKILDRDRLDEDLAKPIGVARLININKSISGGAVGPLQIQMILLEYLSETIAILGKRYIRVHSILHDQERATHGYTTDLLTVAFACRTIQMWLDSGVAQSFVKPREIALKEEITNRVRSIISIQENMSHQLATVARHNDNAFYDIPDHEKRICKTPYKDVFLRVIEAKRGISSCYNRQELIVTSEGEREFSDGFTRMPSIAMTVGELYMVVRNIVENAIKYTPKSERPKIDIVWTINNGLVTYRFRDYGIGVPENERGLLGRESFRGYHARRIQLRGNGLGLAVSKEVVSLHGGALDYEPPPANEKGSIFILKVPIS